MYTLNADGLSRHFVPPPLLQATEEAEAKYAAKINRAMETEPPTWFGRRKVAWFH